MISSSDKAYWLIESVITFLKEVLILYSETKVKNITASFYMATDSKYPSMNRKVQKRHCSNFFFTTVYTSQTGREESQIQMTINQRRTLITAYTSVEITKNV